MNSLGASKDEIIFKGHGVKGQSIAKSVKNRGNFNAIKFLDQSRNNFVPWVGSEIKATLVHFTLVLVSCQSDI